ncbi:hypothetical protein BU26DRAFT_129756 [Trematosphaeria pertusa]|uniref:Secreted protein n=1 Tax=Trematosphaeria pertusa TaxID=390896 RepID=A0A6A6HWQ0_9PLEO|nr:uncharacterized protein BU26DRAFT_129756 [Trematosphaeria pertusa]KAF2242634.1 hypothetical protein BU26DRAFT_129756 [Trematosphaeria pertusa]
MRPPTYRRDPLSLPALLLVSVICLSVCGGVQASISATRCRNTRCSRSRCTQAFALEARCSPRIRSRRTDYAPYASCAIRGPPMRCRGFTSSPYRRSVRFDPGPGAAGVNAVLSSLQHPQSVESAMYA